MAIHNSFGRIVLMLVTLFLGLTFSSLSNSQTTVLKPPSDPDGGAPKFIRQYFGLHMHRAEEIRWPTAPFGSWRMWDAHVTWADIERSPGQFDFSRLDRYVSLAERFGLEIILPIGLSPRWASSKPQQISAYGPGNAAMPADINRWRNFVRTVATRYKGRITAYEVWNEPNIPQFFSGDTDQIVELARILFQEVKAADSNALVIGPAGAGLLDPRRKFLGQFLESGGGDSVDILAFHLYTGEHKPEVMISAVRDLQAQAEAAGFGHLPLWNTESGYLTKSFEHGFGSDAVSALSEKTVADYLVRAMLIARALGVERFNWYAWDDGKYAMTKADFATPNVVGETYASLIRLLVGSQLRECWIDKWGPCHCRLTSPKGRTFWIAWSGRDKVVDWMVPTPVRMLSIDGRVRTPGLATVVRLNSTPVVLEAGAGVLP